MPPTAPSPSRNAAPAATPAKPEISFNPDGAETAPGNGPGPSDQSQSRAKLAFWRPNNKNTGSVGIFEFNGSRMFLVMFPQAAGGPKKFDFEKKITVSLGPTDIGEFLATIGGRQGGCGKNTDGRFSGLYHESKSGVSIIGFSYDEKISKYWLSVSKALPGAKDPTRYNIALSHGEAELLRVYLSKYVIDMLQSNSDAEAVSE